MSARDAGWGAADAGWAEVADPLPLLAVFAVSWLLVAAAWALAWLWYWRHGGDGGDR